MNLGGAFGEGGTGELVKRKGKKIISRKPITATEIANGSVVVPKTFWKVMVVLKKGSKDLERIDADTQTIAVCMPNLHNTRSANWRGFITTIRNVEAATGFDFLSELPSATQNALETKRDSTATRSASLNPCQ